MSTFSLTLNKSTYQTVQMPSCIHCNKIEDLWINVPKLLGSSNIPSSSENDLFDQQHMKQVQSHYSARNRKKTEDINKTRKSLSGCCRFILLRNQRREREIQSQLSLTLSIFPRSKPSKFFNVKNGGKVNLWKRTNWVLDVLLRV